MMNAVVPNADAAPRWQADRRWRHTAERREHAAAFFARRAILRARRADHLPA